MRNLIELRLGLHSILEVSSLGCQARLGPYSLLRFSVEFRGAMEIAILIKKTVWEKTFLALGANDTPMSRASTAPSIIMS